MTFALDSLLFNHFGGMCASMTLCKAELVNPEKGACGEGQAPVSPPGAGRRPSQQPAGVPAKSAQEPVSIRRCRRLADLYEVGPHLHKDQAGVFHARSVKTGRPVVIKTRTKRSFFDARHEGQWRAAMEFGMNMPAHDSIGQTLEVLEDDSEYHVVMERCEGTDLCELLQSRGALRPEEVREITQQLLSGLAHLHGQGWVHRDLKLENVMVGRAAPPAAAADGRCYRSGASDSTRSPDESEEEVSEDSVEFGGKRSRVRGLQDIRVKIIDFDTMEPVGSPGGRTRGRPIFGTDQYLPPEAYTGQHCKASDVFAIGVIAYACLAGKLPFNDEIFDGRNADYFVGSPRMSNIQERLSKAKVDWACPVFQENLLARDLVQRMVAKELCHRPTAQAGLEHSWFTMSPCSGTAPVVRDRARWNTR